MGEQAVKVTVDTNILVRVAVQDDPYQGKLAERVLREAEVIAIAVPVLCEFVWVLSRAYRYTINDIASAIERLTSSESVAVDRPAVDAGLAALKAGGDFADGVIAFEGRRLGGEVFVSFDREAIRLIKAVGGETRLLSSTASRST